MISNPFVSDVTSIQETRGISTVLIVDDDLTSRLILEGILKKEGLRVLLAPSGREGEALAAKEIPDLILMDVNMPDEDGLTVTRNIKSQLATADIPVVFISAQEDIDSKIEGFNAGGVDYITKPYYPAEVLARARLHIRLSHAYQSLSKMHINQLQSLSESQMMLLPNPQMIPDAKFAGFYQACHHAGGDFYDVMHTGELTYDYLVADISGHDLGTALPTAALKALVHQNVDMLYSPQENSVLLNRYLRSVFNEGQYATLLYMRLNRMYGKLTLINSGHPPALLVPKEGDIRILMQSGDPIGIFEVYSPDVLEMNVAKGDRLILFTDGVIEQGLSGPVTRQKGLADLIEAGYQTRELPLEEVPKMFNQILLPPQDQINDDVLILAVEV